MIQVEHLSKRFGSTLAVDDISFGVEQGEVVGFLGPNGAGKSTTIRVLTCFHPATSGRAEVAGFDVFDKPVEVRRNIGYLPENVPIYDDLRVEEYLAYRAELKGVRRSMRRAAVHQAMERCGLFEVRRKLVRHVSRGYRQRVGLADAMVANPQILILDEPTSGLDPNQRRRMKGLIRELAQDHTVLFSSHILSEVADVASRVLLIHHGKLCADGPIDELLSQAPGRSLRITARIDGEALRAVVLELAGCGRAEVERQEDGWATVAVPLRSDQDPRDVAWQRLRALDVPVREFALALPSLEQFFAQVTEGELVVDGAEEARS